ncbi:hypothetical protein GALMADRAFT_215352 [Galerina marginata CBS 339.88]|uniref:Uncharacterized protein n=1 Tax=Galerina marginata (strain CBS 339.88) TaxID=685588 RepID=A0A067SQI8_GALM3|nr:hypothetical protein GALMADRAFT_215352 [Galerina marginata CBS 339.88]
MITIQLLRQFTVNIHLADRITVLIMRSIGNEEPDRRHKLTLGELEMGDKSSESNNTITPSDPPRHPFNQPVEISRSFAMPLWPQSFAEESMASRRHCLMRKSSLWPCERTQLHCVTEINEAGVGEAAYEEVRHWVNEERGCSRRTVVVTMKPEYHMCSAGKHKAGIVGGSGAAEVQIFIQIEAGVGVLANAEWEKRSCSGQLGCGLRGSVGDAWADYTGMRGRRPGRRPGRHGRRTGRDELRTHALHRGGADSRKTKKAAGMRKVCEAGDHRLGTIKGGCWEGQRRRTADGKSYEEQEGTRAEESEKERRNARRRAYNEVAGPKSGWDSGLG